MSTTSFGSTVTDVGAVDDILLGRGGWRVLVYVGQVLCKRSRWARLFSLSDIILFL